VVQDARVSSGEDRDLERLYRADGERLWRSLLVFAGDREVASDAMAEAFAQALGRGDMIRDRRRWVWRAAFRIAAGQLKERGRLRPLERDMAVEAPEPAGELLRAIATLSPNQRAAVVLRYYVGYSTAEIATILSASAATVRVHLSQGRRRLRKLLEAERDA
jgi:RNA polymerase sigma-70 factor (ECF subfamily)